MSAAPSEEVTAPGLAAALRTGTRPAHEQTEGSSFVSQLIAGELPLSAYTALVAQNYGIYRALEEVTIGWLGDPVAGPFVRAELMRVPELERDLLTLLGPQWASVVPGLLVPATNRYAAHVRERCARSSGAFVAHHYVRYLGDLSGGQILHSALRRRFGAAVEQATHFYTFRDVGKIKPFRDDYRRRLDQLPVTDPERERIVAEAVYAFELNRAVFVELGRRGPTDESTVDPSVGPAA